MNFQNIFINRRGLSENASMVTNELIRIYKPYSVIYLKNGKLIETTDFDYKIPQIYSSIPPNIYTNN